MTRISDNPYVPRKAVLLSRKELSPTCTLYRFRGEGGGPFSFTPGQFLLLTVPGVGEAPFSISSAPSEDGTFEFCIKRVGRVTDHLHRSAREGDVFGIRGPYGRGFPVEEMKGKDVLFIAGGIGYAPLRSVLLHLLKERESVGQISFLYGVNTPVELIFRDEVREQAEAGTVHYWISLMEGDLDDFPAPWSRGLVTDFIPRVPADPENAIALLVGPPVMYRTAVEKLFEKGFREENIFLSLERRMECGIGKCGHCAIGYRYTCVHGPVFPYFEAITLTEAI